MKQSTLLPFSVQGNVQSVFHQIFSDDVLRAVHGPSVAIAPWVNDRRSISFDMSVEHVPAVIRRFFLGDRLRVTSRQRLQRQFGEYRVAHSLHLHVIGSSLFSVRPVFALRQVGDRTVVDARVESNAVLPPPINRVAETFMAANAQRELDHFRNCVRASVPGVQDV